MTYVPLEELVSELPAKHIVKYLDDAQLERCYTDAYVANISADDERDTINAFLHYVWENTDMSAEWTIDEELPRHYDGIPDRGKTHDAADEVWREAFNDGIEHCMQWLFAEIDAYYQRYIK